MCLHCALGCCLPRVLKILYVLGSIPDRFGEALDVSEQEWLVAEINEQIQDNQGGGALMNMPPEDIPPQVGDSDDMVSSSTFFND